MPLNQIFTSKHITTYWQAEGKTTNATNIKDRITQSGNEHKRNADISDATKRRLKKMCATWFELLSIYNMPRQKKEQLLPTFTTLTYPILQTEDLTARKNELNRFMIYMQRKNFMKRYIWKAEAQKNGSLHYHIVSDQFINKDLVRETWNKCIPEAIAQYGKEAYGTRIESVKDYDKAISYVLKYMTKNSEERRQIGGNKWGSSDNLKKLSYFTETNPDIIRYNNMELENAGLELIPINDFCQTAPLRDKLLKLITIFDQGSQEEILNTYETNYELLFNQKIYL